MRQSIAVNISNRRQYAKKQGTVEQAVRKRLYLLFDQLVSAYVLSRCDKKQSLKSRHRST